MIRCIDVCMGNVHALIRGQRRSRGIENPIETSRLEVRRLDAANRIPELRPKARFIGKARGEAVAGHSIQQAI